MINPNELRIGNIIWDDVCNELHGSGLVKIKSLSDTVAHYTSLTKSGFGKLNSGVEYVNAKGVEITKEILEKTNAIKDNYGLYFFRRDGIKKSESGMDVLLTIRQYLINETWVWECCIGCFPETTHLCDILYLHQLQNLYFTLNEKELIING